MKIPLDSKIDKQNEEMKHNEDLSKKATAINSGNMEPDENPSVDYSNKYPDEMEKFTHIFLVMELVESDMKKLMSS